MRGEILVSNPHRVVYENEKKVLQEFNNFKEKFLKPQYKDVRYLKIEDNRIDDYYYQNIDITIDLLTGEVFSNTNNSIYEMCKLREEIEDYDNFKFNIDLLQKDRNGKFFIHKKLADTGIYTFLDSNKKELEKIENEYVLNGLDIEDAGYGDYIIMVFIQKENKTFISSFNSDVILLNLCKEEYKDLINKLEAIHSHYKSCYINAEDKDYLYRSFNF